MKKLLTISILLALTGLIACEDKATQQQDFDFSNQQTSEEIKQLETIIAKNPGDLNSLSYLADLYFEAGQYNEALQVYDKAIAVDPACADCFNDRGLALFYLGDASAALESFDTAVTLRPGFTRAWLSKGFVLTAEGRYQEAIVPLNKVKELDSTGALAQQADKYLAEAAGKNLQ